MPHYLTRTAALAQAGHAPSRPPRPGVWTVTSVFGRSSFPVNVTQVADWRPRHAAAPRAVIEVLPPLARRSHQVVELFT
jgi:hypothetical protein